MKNMGTFAKIICILAILATIRYVVSVIVTKKDPYEQYINETK